MGPHRPGLPRRRQPRRNLCAEGSDATASYLDVPLHTSDQPHERRIRPDPLPGRLSALLPAQPAGDTAGNGSWGPRHQHRPGDLDRAPDRHRGGRRRGSLVGKRRARPDQLLRVRHRDQPSLGRKLHQSRSRHGSAATGAGVSASTPERRGPSTTGTRCWTWARTTSVTQPCAVSHAPVVPIADRSSQEDPLAARIGRALFCWGWRTPNYVGCPNPRVSRLSASHWQTACA